MNLRDYQQADVNKLSALNTMGIFNEQRTGKTPTALNVLKAKRVNKPLIVCPASAQYPWADEYIKWLNKKDVCIAVGTPKKREEIITNWKSGALICSYGVLKTTGTAEMLLKQEPEAVIFDEAHRFKEQKTLIFQCVRKFTAVPIRMLLTGTPAPNKPYEIWALLYMIDPKLWNSYWKFIDDFFIKRRVTIGVHTFMDIGDAKKDKLPTLQYYLDQHCVQHKRKEVMQWLPNKDYIDIPLPPTKAQQQYLKSLHDYFEVGNIVCFGPLDRLIRYRQVCLHPALLGLKGTSPKIDWLLSYFADYPDTPTIIFSFFTSFLKLAAIELQKKRIEVGEIYGETSAANRATLVKRFQSGKLNVLLINIVAGKEALTLDRAEAIVFTDQYPPAGDIQQAEDRFVATVKERANKPHNIYRLMMAGTYDAELYKLVGQRKDSTEIINDFKKYIKENE